MREGLLIVNPISGHGHGRKIAPVIEAALQQAGYAVKAQFTEKAGDGKNFARDAGKDIAIVAVIGGDGTLNEILNGLPRPIPLALFPLGTANVMAHELGLPRDPAGFSAMLANPTIQSLDCLRVGHRLAFFSVGCGIDGMAIAELQRRRKGAISKATYIPVMASCIRRYRTPRLRVQIENESFEDVSFALFANTLHYGGKVFRLSAQRKLDDGLWECYLFSGKGRVALLRYLARGLFQRLLVEGDPIVRTGKRFRVASMEPGVEIPYQIDGDLGGTTPFEAQLVAKHMQILIPRKVVKA